MIPRIFKRQVTVHRPGVGEYINGIWVDLTPTTTFTIWASVQPIKEQELESLPEGLRTSDVFKMYTNTHLLTAREDIKNPDEVDLYGERYLVADVEIWGNTQLSHYKILVIKSNVKPSATTDMSDSRKARLYGNSPDI